MRHIQLIINTFASNISFLLLFSTVFMFLRTRREEYFFRIIVIVSSLFLFIPHLVDSYRFNLTGRYQQFFAMGPRLSVVLITLALVFYVNSLCNPPKKRQINYGISIFCVFLIIHYTICKIFNFDILLSEILRTIGLAVSVFYLGIRLIIGRYESLTKMIRQNRVFIGWITIFSLPFFIFIDVLKSIDIFSLIGISKTIIVVPLYFSVWYMFMFHEDLVSILFKKHTRNFSDFCRAFKLSPRETEVTKLLIEGFSYAEIGNKLFISKETVKVHIRSIYSKTETGSKVKMIKKMNQFCE